MPTCTLGKGQMTAGTRRILDDEKMKKGLALRQRQIN